METIKVSSAIWVINLVEGLYGWIIYMIAGYMVSKGVHLPIEQVNIDSKLWGKAL